MPHFRPPLRREIMHPSHQHISGDRRGQPSQNAMERLQSRPTAALIAVQPVPGKYAVAWLYVSYSTIH